MVTTTGRSPIREKVAACFSSFCKAPDRSNAKVRQLLDSAYRLFLVQPYDAVSTDAIAREAKVSKATLYAHFASKEALFAALVEEQCGDLSEALWAEAPGSDDVAAVLHTIARNFVGMFVTGKAMSLYRIIAAEVPRFPELGRGFFEVGPGTLHSRIAEFLRHADERGLLRVPDPHLAAVQFIALISCEIPLYGMLGLDPMPATEVQRRVDSGIAMFLAAYAVPGGKPA